MQSDVSYGRVPTGKASALRTMGTTLSLLSQTDVQSERILRRLFAGLSQAHQLMHRLNRHFLPEHKEIRVFGVAEKGQDAYMETSMEQVDADVDFAFRATLLNANKEAVSAAISEIAGLLISPLAVQMGLLTKEKFYNLMRDKVKSRDLDSDRYVERPPEESQGPQILAEDALSAVLQGEMPIGRPLEGAMEHLQKIVKLGTEAGQKGLLTEISAPMLNAWIEQVKGLAQAEMQKQQMMQAAQQFQGSAANGGAQPGGVPTTFNRPIENPPVQPGEAIDESLTGEQG